MNADEPRHEDVVRAAAEAFQLGGPRRIWPLGGTATRKFAFETPRGRFVARFRPEEFADGGMIGFEHEILWRLVKAGLPVPSPQKRTDGTSCLIHGRRVVEVHSWVEGQPFVPGDRAAVRNVGRFLAQFHAAIVDPIPPGKENFLREDHPDLLLPYVQQLEELSRSHEETEQIRSISGQIEYVRAHLDRQLWLRLPMAVTHGDIHPGNVRFRDSRVAAVYDFDYLSVQARIKDICDGLIFFAARRDSPLDPDDIVSLTQAFVLDEELARILLDGYQEVAKLVDVEWEAMPLEIRSQWLQFRLRGSRKVPREEKVSYVLHRFSEVIDWLDRDAAGLFERLRVS
jgi:Ser/Thr protein kinase RdoA (MazF antagonist)